MSGRDSSTPRPRACAGPRPTRCPAATRSAGARTPPATSSANASATAKAASALSMTTSFPFPKVPSWYFLSLLSRLKQKFNRDSVFSVCPSCLMAVYGFDNDNLLEKWNAYECFLLKIWDLAYYVRVLNWNLQELRGFLIIYLFSFWLLIVQDCCFSL